jgi:hypothetical protein
MVRHLSTGTAIIVALMAAHRLARNQSQGSRTLDDFFKQEAARIGGCWDKPDRLDSSGEDGRSPRCHQTKSPV